MTRKGGKRHMAQQIVEKLRDADVMLAAGKPIDAVCQALEVSEATFHRWRNQYGGMKVAGWPGGIAPPRLPQTRTCGHYRIRFLGIMFYASTLQASSDVEEGTSSING